MGRQRHFPRGGAFHDHRTPHPEAIFPAVRRLPPLGGLEGPRGKMDAGGWQDLRRRPTRARARSISGGRARRGRGRGRMEILTSEAVVPIVIQLDFSKCPSSPTKHRRVTFEHAGRTTDQGTGAMATGPRNADLSKVDEALLQQGHGGGPAV